MESTEMKGICLICLKRFDLSSSDNKKAVRYEPRYLTVGTGFESSSVPEDPNETDSFRRRCDDIYARFLHLSCRYLKLTSTAEVFLMAATSYKKDTGECLQAFCEDCKCLVSYICDLYAELQALKMRLINKLGLIVEVMEDRKKFMPCTLLNRLGMELKEQLHVKSRLRVESFRMAFRLKCKSKLKNDTPKVLVPRGLLPEEWKFGYAACKFTLMRLIIIFALASSKVLTTKENQIVSIRNDLRPQIARRRKGRPKPKSILKANNEIPKNCGAHGHIQSYEKPDEMKMIKTEAEGNNKALLESTEGGFNDNQHQQDLGNDNNSDFSHGAPSPMSMEASVAGSDDDFLPYSEIEEEEEKPASSPGKRWNLRKRKRNIIILAQESDSSDHSENDYEKPYERTKKSKSKYPDEPPKNLRGWPRVGDCEPSVPCTKCNKMFLDKRSLATHSVYVHNVHNSYTCVHCGQTFRRWKDRQNHRKKVHPIKRTNFSRRHPKKVQPEKAKSERKPRGRPRKPNVETQVERKPRGRPRKPNSKTQVEMKKRVRSKKPKVKKQKPKCQKCDLFFTTFEDLHQHKVEIHINDKYSKQPRERKCLKCPEVFMSFKEWRRHKITVHGLSGRTTTYKCLDCPELTFPNWTSKWQHRKKIHPFNGYGKPPVGPTKCLDCDKQFPTGKEMMEHRKAEHKYKYVQYFILASGKFQCKKCNDTFATKELVLEHRKISHHIEYTKHECPICYRTVLSLGRFKAHLTRHRLNKSKIQSQSVQTVENWYCEVCSKHFHSTTTLQNHMTKLHQDKYTCYICKVSMETGKHLRDHLVEHEKPEKYFYCMVCFQGFSNLQYYDIHRRITHLDQRRFYCDYNYCNEILDTMEQLSLHMETHLQDGRTEDTSEEWKDIHKCEKCDKPFIKNYNFTIHSLTHTELNKEKTGYDCPLCGHSVKYMDSLISHYNRLHGLNIIPCKCYICEKGFYSRLAYNQHIRECAYTQPQLENNLVCNFCGVKFGDKESLQEHKKEIHYAEARSKVNELKVCPEEGCGEMRTSAQMNSHLAKAHGKGDRYPCEKCGKSFEEVARLKDHLKEVHGEGEYKCATCGKAFGKPSNLKRHELARHGENSKTASYCCHLCGLSYFSEQGLRYHNWSVHKDVYLKELKHKCPYCDKLYGRKHLMTAHVKNCRAKLDKRDDGEDKKPIKNVKRRNIKDEEDEKEMTDKSTTEDEYEEDKLKPSPALSQSAPVLYPQQMPQAVPSLPSATLSFQQWLNTTAAVGLGACDNQQQNFIGRPMTQRAEEMQTQPLQSQLTIQSEESLHQL